MKQYISFCQYNTIQWHLICAHILQPLNIIKLWICPLKAICYLRENTTIMGPCPAIVNHALLMTYVLNELKFLKKKTFLRQICDFFKNWSQHLSGCQRVFSAVCQACEGSWSCGRHWPDQVPCWLSLQHDWCHFPEGPQRPPCLEGEPLVHEKRQYRKRDREIIW